MDNDATIDRAMAMGEAERGEPAELDQEEQVAVEMFRKLLDLKLALRADGTFQFEARMLDSVSKKYSDPRSIAGTWELDGTTLTLRDGAKATDAAPFMVGEVEEQGLLLEGGIFELGEQKFACVYRREG